MKVIGDHDYPLLDKYNSVGFGMYTIGIQQTVDEAPTIDPESLRPKGRWIDRMVRDWVCSECGGLIQKVRNVDGYCYDDKPNYCPDCGADMREG